MKFTPVYIIEIIIGLSGLLSVIAQAILIWKQSKNKRGWTRKSENLFEIQENTSSGVKRKNVIFLILSLVVFICALYVMKKHFLDSPVPDNIFYLTKAEDALNVGDYKTTIIFADRCINQFKKKALQLEYKLDSLNVTLPVGPMDDQQLKDEICSHGLLNDVATAYFYKGKAAEALYNSDNLKNLKYKKMAIDAYTFTYKLNNGRRWDPSGRGFFWSPSDGADKRLKELR